MDKTVIGIFEPLTNTEHLINDLQADGYNPRDVSIVMRDRDDVKDMHESKGTAVGKIADGMATGAIIGSVMGLLAAIVIPGIGALLIGGPIAEALGLTGITATVASGASTGAIAGGLIGALMGFGLPREDAERYQKRIKEGAILIAVPTTSSGAEEVETLFHDYHAIEIQTLTHPRKNYRQQRQYGYASKGGRAHKTVKRRHL